MMLTFSLLSPGNFKQMHGFTAGQANLALISLFRTRARALFLETWDAFFYRFSARTAAKQNAMLSSELQRTIR